MTENFIAEKTLDAAFRIHNRFGNSLLENAYEQMLAASLRKGGFSVETQKSLDIQFDNIHIPNAYRLDILVENIFIIEIKAVSALRKEHHSQTNTYLKLTNIKLGLLINFGAPSLKNQFKRIINTPNLSRSET